MKDKIQSNHLQRRAVVYLRQSTMRQVHEYKESTARQYDLKQRAIELGWSSDAVQVVDEDLGQSGTSTQGREGFTRLAEDVAAGRVGTIFALEASRLARSSADWHRLLDLCRLADVLIADENGIYAPRDPNDRLLLGLKGQMSEAEQYWMRLRLEGGRMNKARRGALFIMPPTGYQWDEATERLRFDPNEEVQRAVALVFERFRIDGSAHGVAAGLARKGITLPSRDSTTGENVWSPPSDSLIVRMLHNPLYAGTYTYGRTEERAALVNGEIRRRRVTQLAQNAWKACLHDHHPAYIGWEEFMANQEKLNANRSNHQTPDQRGAAREGAALLQGLVICGRCGHRMGVAYASTDHRLVYYTCAAPGRHTGLGDACWSLAGRGPEEAVQRLFLQAAQPPEIELSFAVAREAEKQATEIDRQWKMRLERVHYEAKIAERRYKAVDPDNRVVVRTLERDWDEKLQEVERVEREYADTRRREKVDLTEEDRSQILELARNLPRVWQAATTTQAQRKNLLRMLVREVTLTPIDVPERTTKVEVLWETGAVSEVIIARPSKHTASRSSPAAEARVRELIEAGVACDAVAETLNRAGLVTGKGLPWDREAVWRVKRRLGVKSPPPPAPPPRPRSDGLLSSREIGARFGMTVPMIHYWIGKGLIKPAAGGGNGVPWKFRLDDDTVRGIEEAVARGNGPQGRVRRDGQKLS